MSSSAVLLWQLNHNYVNRLARARSYFDLLEPLLDKYRAKVQDSLLSAMPVIHARLTFLSAEHRGWCYAFFYESPESKRMVQTPGAVRRALTNFVIMCDRHKESLNEMIALFADLPRPDPSVTRIPGGDLWDLMLSALHDLVDFSNDLNARDSA